MACLVIKTPAKINLALAVNPEIQNSKHKISSWMSGINLFDILTIKKTPKSNSSYKRTVRKLNNKGFAITWEIEKDLIFQAHQKIEKHVGKKLSAAITLEKHIPPGRGLGGGSSNAAGILLGLQKLFNIKILKKDLLKIALDLGSDVPFFLNQENSIVSGTGEQVTGCQEPIKTNLVIVIPDCNMSTKKIYDAFDKNPTSKFNGGEIKKMSQNKPITENLFNDLADACFRINPKIKENMNVVENLCASKTHLTGSGSSFFLIAKNKPEANLWAKKIKDKINMTALAKRCGEKITWEHEE